MQPKTKEMSYQEAENIIRSHGHSISRRKTPLGLVNTVTWSMPNEGTETTEIKTELTNEEVKTVGSMIKRLNTDSVILASLVSHASNKDSKPPIISGLSF